jgi:hypothetical protein
MSADDDDESDHAQRGLDAALPHDVCPARPPAHEQPIDVEHPRQVLAHDQPQRDPAQGLGLVGPDPARRRLPPGPDDQRQPARDDDERHQQRQRQAASGPQRKHSPQVALIGGRVLEQLPGCDAAVRAGTPDREEQRPVAHEAKHQRRHEGAGGALHETGHDTPHRGDRHRRQLDAFATNDPLGKDRLADPSDFGRGEQPLRLAHLATPSEPGVHGTEGEGRLLQALAQPLPCLGNGTAAGRVGEIERIVDPTTEQRGRGDRQSKKHEHHGEQQGDRRDQHDVDQPGTARSETVWANHD